MKNNFGIWTSFGRCDFSEKQMEEWREEYYNCFNEYPSNEEALEAFINDEINRNLQNELDNIEYHERYHDMKQYIIFGTIHCWNGDFEVAKIVQGMEEVIETCFKHQNNSEIYFLNGQLRINTYNHDSDCSGNFFRIREVTDLGRDYYINHWAEDEFKLLKHMFHNSHYTHRVTIFNEIYGC